jgi:hypothetical protein
MLARTRPYRKLGVRETAATAGSHKSPAACFFTKYRSYSTHHTVIKKYTSGSHYMLFCYQHFHTYMALFQCHEEYLSYLINAAAHIQWVVKAVSLSHFICHSLSITLSTHSVHFHFTGL